MNKKKLLRILVPVLAICVVAGTALFFSCNTFSRGSSYSSYSSYNRDPTPPSSLEETPAQTEQTPAFEPETEPTHIETNPESNEDLQPYEPESYPSNSHVIDPYTPQTHRTEPTVPKPEPTPKPEPDVVQYEPEKADESPKQVLDIYDKQNVHLRLQYLSNHRPEMNMQCRTCGGSGRKSTPCKYCGGSGQRMIEGVTAFVAVVNCTYCKDGYPACDDCTFGIMLNPNYEAEHEAWTEERHELWRSLGYTDAEIRQMEIDEAKALLPIDPDPDDTSTIDIPAGICKVCFGTGDCSTCDGDRKYMNPYTGELITCPNCKDGRCWKCGGTGKAS